MLPKFKRTFSFIHSHPLAKKYIFKAYTNFFLWQLQTFLFPEKLYVKHFIGNVNFLAKKQLTGITGNIYCGLHEFNDMGFLLHFLRSEDTFFDIGANIGFHTLYFAELVGKKGKVYAIEPININFKALTANLALNQFTNIVPVNKAFGNKTETIEIHIDINQTNPGAFSIIAEGAKNTMISCMRGDDYLRESGIEKVDVFKIDVEGFEFEVLKGLTTTIVKHRPVIFFEYDQNYQLRGGVNPKVLFGFLADKGYQFYKIDAYGNQLKYHYSGKTIGAEILAIPYKQLN